MNSPKYLGHSDLVDVGFESVDSDLVMTGGSGSCFGCCVVVVDRL